LGNVAEQQKALAEFRRLHDIANQQKEVEPVFSPREVTKQEVDPAPSSELARCAKCLAHWTKASGSCC
jgi:hypothetical protein